MNFAFLIGSGFSNSCKRLFRFLHSRELLSASYRPQHKSIDVANATESTAACALSTSTNATYHVKSRPLRVLRVIESNQSRVSVGRMVISGRMADVCAELDRLAANETLAA